MCVCVCHWGVSPSCCYTKAAYILLLFGRPVSFAFLLEWQVTAGQRRVKAVNREIFSFLNVLAMLETIGQESLCPYWCTAICWCNFVRSSCSSTVGFRKIFMSFIDWFPLCVYISLASNFLFLLFLEVFFFYVSLSLSRKKKKGRPPQ